MKMSPQKGEEACKEGAWGLEIARVKDLSN